MVDSISLARLARVVARHATLADVCGPHDRDGVAAIGERDRDACELVANHPVRDVVRSMMPAPDAAGVDPLRAASLTREIVGDVRDAARAATAMPLLGGERDACVVALACDRHPQSHLAVPVK